MFRWYGSGYERNPAKIYVQVYHSGDTVSQNSGGDMEILFHQVNYTASNVDLFSPEVIGYMTGKGYVLVSESYNWYSDRYFGSDVTYENGQYTLVDPVLGYNSSHKYSCHSTNPNEGCESISYQAVDYWSVTFTEGDTINNFNHNTTDSANKNRIDFIYSTYLTDYTSYLEDTPYCNDRSGNLSLFSTYNAYDRVENGTPSLSCSKNDSFTVSNSIGNQALTYPTGALSADELMYAGLTPNDNNSNNYLNIGAPYWTMTPRNYDKDNYGNVYFVDANGKINYSTSHNHSYFSRGVVSLKPDTMIIGGNGTISNPYRVAQ